MLRASQAPPSHLPFRFTQGLTRSEHGSKLRELSAPAGQRAVMISTHCELAEWQDLNAADYSERKRAMTEKLLTLARRVYPDLGSRAVVCELGTPRTFERYTRRPLGAVGGYRQWLGNTNQHAIPQRLPVPGFWLAGDTTWPGLGTVACVHGSRIVAEGILASVRTRSDKRSPAITYPHSPELCESKPCLRS